MTPAGRSPKLLKLLTLLLISATLPCAHAECTFDFNDCMELYQLEVNDNDIYIVGGSDVYDRVFCYNNATLWEGGGWTGVLRQFKNGTPLTLSWNTETGPMGSGSLFENFWIGTTALSHMTDINMTLVVRALTTSGQWRVGLFEKFKIEEGSTLSPSMEYVDGNIGLEKSIYDTIAMSGSSCLGYWWYPDCLPSTENSAGSQPTDEFTSVEISIRPTANDTIERACPPFYPFPRNTTELGLTVTYQKFWRADGGSVSLACTDPDHALIWNQTQVDLLRSGENASSVTSEQTFTCSLTDGVYSWSVDAESLPDGPRCMARCDPGYASNLEPGANFTCLKFIENAEAVNLQKAWEICQAEGASLANPFTMNGTLQTFISVAAGQSVYTSVDLRTETIISPGAVDASLMQPEATLGTKDCIFFNGDTFVTQPCFPETPNATTGAVCQKPRVCPEYFRDHTEWGCYISDPVIGVSPVTPSTINNACATQRGSSLPPHTAGSMLEQKYISAVNRRGDNTTWRDADGTEVSLQVVVNTDDVSKQCLMVNADGSLTAVGCDVPLEDAGITLFAVCVYPRLTDCYSNAPMPSGAASVDRSLDSEGEASCPAGLMFSATNQSSGTLKCHGALGNWLPADLGGCVTKCGSPPVAPPHSVMSPEESRSQTSYTYTCSAGLQTADGTPQTTITCQESGVYDPPLPAKCSQCTGFPATDETMALETEVTNGIQEQSVLVSCGENMTTADGQSNQFVTCGPTGWTPAKLTSCNVCSNEPLVDTSSITVKLPETSGLGSIILYSCPAGKAFDSGSNLTSAVCMPDGWFSCHQQLNCSLCVDEPPAALDNMNRTWSDFNQTADYSCADPLTLDGFNNTQTLSCEMEGWEQTLLPCDKCVEPNATVPGYTVSWEGLQLDNSTLTLTCPAGKVHKDLTAEQLFSCTAAGWQSDNPLPCDRCAAPVARPESKAAPSSTDAGVQEEQTLAFNCNTGLATAEGLTSFTETCLNDGWTATGSCSHCAGEPPASNRSVSRSWAEEKTMGAAATYTCSNGVVLVVACGATGWNGTTDPCDQTLMHCGAPPRDAFNGTQPEDTGKGTEPSRTATYRCSNSVTSVLRCLKDGTWSTDQTPCASPLNACPAPPATPADATLADSGPYSFGQRNVTYTCADNTKTVLYCQNSIWTAGVEPCAEGTLPAPPPPPPGVFVIDTGPVTGENGTITQSLTYDCGTGVTTLTWRDGAWRPENALPCADPKNACPARNDSVEGVTFVDTGPYSDGVRSATYNCSGAGLADTFECVDGSWSPENLGACDDDQRLYRCRLHVRSDAIVANPHPRQSPV